MAEVRYCTTEDGVRIAYSVEGSGPPLVICPYFLDSAAFESTSEQWRSLIERLQEGRQVLRYDMRGTGLSQKDDIEITAERNVADFEAVVSAAGLGRFNLLGWVLSAYVAMEYAARHPDRVARLVLYAPFARADDVMSEENRRALAALCRSNWELASQTFVDMSWRQESSEMGIAAAETVRDTFDGEVLATTLEMAVDATASLPNITTPTLVLHRVNDSTLPFSASQKVAARIPGARLVPLQGNINYPALGDVDSVVNTIRSFLNEGAEPPPEPAVDEAAATGGFRTILFTDVVGHTAMMRRLGDEAGREVLREHERIIRDVLKRHGGTEVKTMGDGFMAAFASVTKAVGCSIALQRAFGKRNLSAGEPLFLRVGLNAGEPIDEDGDLFGEVVILAARIAAQAEGGEILGSLGVRELCAGKGFLFADRGEHVLRGFEDPVPVFEVSWRE